MTKNLKIDSKIIVAGKDGKNYTCNTILLKEMSVSNFEVYVKIEGIISKIMMEMRDLTPVNNSNKTDSIDNKADSMSSKNMWTALFLSPIKPFSSEYIIELKNILLDNNLVFCVVKEDEVYPLSGFLEQITSVKDIYAIIGGYLDGFFSI